MISFFINRESFMSNNILDLIKVIPDPLLGLNAEAMAVQIHLKEQQPGSVQMQAGFPTLALETSWLAQIKSALAKIYPDQAFNIKLDFFIKAHQTQLLGKGLRGVKNTIAIASGKGGVGKSTVTVNLATALARAGAKVGILDADIYGPSIPLMLGQNQRAEISGDHYLPVSAHQVQTMSIGYLTDNNQALIWRGPMLAKSLIQMIDITLWDDLDYLLIDLPPGTGDIQLSLVQKIPLTAALVVTTPQQVATLDAQKALRMFSTTGIDVLGLIENMSFHTCSQCGHQDALFGHGGAQKLSDESKIPLLGQIPLDSQIQEDCDKGLPTALRENDLANLWMKIALNTAIKLAKKPLNYAGKFPAVIVE